jgi:probable F420-dependent oxidoreductase
MAARDENDRGEPDHGGPRLGNTSNTDNSGPGSGSSRSVPAYAPPVPADLGRVGIWTFALDQLPAARAREAAAELETMGWGAIWIPEAVGRDPLVSAALLLSATQRCVVATGIASIYARDPLAMTSGWHALSEAFPNRFVLGLGVSHRPMVEGMRGGVYRAPLATMHAYLDGMDRAPYLAAPPTAPPERVLAALGPKMLQLARDRTRGAHPYLVTPEHTATARSILGPDRLLAPEQKVLLETDPDRARRIARESLAVYLPSLPNYVNNVRRLGFTDDDLGDPLSDRLVDALVAWGTIDSIAARIRAHHDAGADHVAVHVLPMGDPERVMADYWTLSAVLP